MKRYFGIMTAALFLSALPGAGLAQNDAGIPPMLETQRPLATVTTQPDPRPPQIDKPKRAVSTPTRKKTTQVQRQNPGKTKMKAASQKKTVTPVKKKNVTARSRSKVAATR